MNENSKSSEKNTMIEPEIDVPADVDAINQGLGTRNGNEYTINGRTYEVQHGSLIPKSGIGFHPLSQGGFIALRILSKYGDTPDAEKQFTREKVGATDVDAAREIWNLGH